MNTFICLDCHSIYDIDVGICNCGGDIVPIQDAPEGEIIE